MKSKMTILTDTLLEDYDIALIDAAKYQVVLNSKFDPNVVLSWIDRVPVSVLLSGSCATDKMIEELINLK